MLTLGQAPAPAVRGRPRGARERGRNPRRGYDALREDPPWPALRRPGCLHRQERRPLPRARHAPHLDGDPERGLTDLHAGGHDHRRQGATATLKEPEPEAGL
jgi:hypothetical protein